MKDNWVSNYTNELSIQKVRVFPRFQSWRNKNTLIVMTTSILRNNIYLNGHIIGYVNPQYNNYIMNTQLI